MNLLKCFRANESILTRGLLCYNGPAAEGQSKDTIRDAAEKSLGELGEMKGKVVTSEDVKNKIQATEDKIKAIGNQSPKAEGTFLDQKAVDKLNADKEKVVELKGKLNTLTGDLKQHLEELRTGKSEILKKTITEQLGTGKFEDAMKTLQDATGREWDVNSADKWTQGERQNMVSGYLQAMIRLGKFEEALLVLDKADKDGGKSYGVFGDDDYIDEESFQKNTGVDAKNKSGELSFIDSSLRQNDYHGRTRYKVFVDTLLKDAEKSLNNDGDAIARYKNYVEQQFTDPSAKICQNLKQMAEERKVSAMDNSEAENKIVVTSLMTPSEWSLSEGDGKTIADAMPKIDTRGDTMPSGDDIQVGNLDVNGKNVPLQASVPPPKEPTTGDNVAVGTDAQGNALRASVPPKAEGPVDGQAANPDQKPVTEATQAGAKAPAADAAAGTSEKAPEKKKELTEAEKGTKSKEFLKGKIDKGEIDAGKLNALLKLPKDKDVKTTSAEELAKAVHGLQEQNKSLVSDGQFGTATFKAFESQLKPAAAVADGEKTEGGKDEINDEVEFIADVFQNRPEFKAGAEGKYVRISGTGDNLKIVFTDAMKAKMADAKIAKKGDWTLGELVKIPKDVMTVKVGSLEFSRKEGKGFVATSAEVKPSGTDGMEVTLVRSEKLKPLREVEKTVENMLRHGEELAKLKPQSPVVISDNDTRVFPKEVTAEVVFSNDQYKYTITDGSKKTENAPRDQFARLLKEAAVKRYEAEHSVA